MHCHSTSSLLVIALTCCWSASGAAQGGPTPSSVEESPPSSTTAGNGSPSGTSGPDQVHEAINIALNGTIYPPTIFSGDVTIPKDITVTCTDCSIGANISLSAGGSIAGDQIATPSDVIPMASGFNFKDYWVGATFDSLEADLEFAVNLSASSSQNQLIIPINTTSITKTFDFLTLTAILNTEIHASINTTTDVNFTYGYKFSVPAGSEILVDLEHINKSGSYGFDQATLTPTAFNTTTPYPSFSVSLSFRPSITFIASIGIPGAHATVQLATTLDIPQLTAQISQVHNVTASCNPPTPGISADELYANLTLIAPSLNVDAFEVFSEIGRIPGLKLEADEPFSQTSPPKALGTGCLLFDPAKEVLGLVPVKRPSSVSSGAVAVGKGIGVTCGWMAAALVIVAAMNMGL